MLTLLQVTGLNQNHSASGMFGVSPAFRTSVGDTPN